jgi:hypothetical protein
VPGAQAPSTGNRAHSIKRDLPFDRDDTQLRAARSRARLQANDIGEVSFKLAQPLCADPCDQSRHRRIRRHRRGGQ